MVMVYYCAVDTLPNGTEYSLTFADKALLLRQHGISIRAFARELGISHVAVIRVVKGQQRSRRVSEAIDAKVADILAAGKPKTAAIEQPRDRK
jgi:hypothetical protein